MKKIISLILLLTSFSFLQTASYGNSKLVTYFGKSNFMAIGSTTLDATFTISTPGVYVLTENITSAVTSNQIIHINADNVVVDLNGFTITGQSASNMNGIEVATGKNNIEIRNGTVYSVGNSGIFVNESAHNIKISNVTCNSCNLNNGATSAGIYLNGSSGTEIAHCAIDNCITFSVVPQAADAYGIYASSTQNLTINNCRAENIRNIGNSYTATGYYVENSTYPTITHSNAYLCEGNNEAAGVVLLTCTGATVRQCTSKGSLANDIAEELDTGRAYGFYFNDANNCLIKDCNSINNRGGNSGTGFYIVSCFNNRFINCIGQGNHSTSSSASEISAGFKTTRDVETPKGATMSCIFDRCSGIGQHSFSGDSSGAAGFVLGGTTRFCMIENSLALGNNGVDGAGYGIFLSGDNLLMNVIKKNTAVANTVASSGNAYGIYEDTKEYTNTLFFENICGINADTDGTTVSNLASGVISIPSYSTNTETYENTQVNTNGWNFVAATSSLP